MLKNLEEIHYDLFDNSEYCIVQYEQLVSRIELG